MTGHERIVLAILAALVSLPASADLWGELEKGPFEPGFESLNRVDETRPAGDDPEVEDSRPVQLAIWYPARQDASGKEPMTVRDYVRLTAEEFAARPADVGDPARDRAEDSIGDFPLDAVADSIAARALALESRAMASAAPAAGRFPLLIVLPGNHDPAWRHFVLAEYLASNGYVVAAFPSAARRGRDSFDMSMSYAAFRDQLADTLFALDYLSVEDSRVDPDRIMFFGFSMGGNTGGLNLLRAREVQGFVCLDCGIGSTWGTPYLNARFDGTFPGAAQRELAFLHVSEGGERNDDSFIDRFTGAHAYHAIVPEARHFDFTSLGAIAGEIPGIEHDRWLSGGQTSREIHDQSAERVLQFLDAHLKGTSRAAALLREQDRDGRVNVHRVAEPVGVDRGPCN